MTEAAAPSEREVNVRHHVYRIMDAHLERAFDELDALHKRGFADDEVIKALRDGHYTSEADAYIEWADCADPDVDPAPQGEELVTDPADSPSYANHPLSQPAVGDSRIDSGLFYAERSSDGVHWHVYKRRNQSDNGAYLATSDSREGAQLILDSLGTGQP